MNRTYKQRHAIWQKNYISFLLPIFISLFLILFVLPLTTHHSPLTGTASATTSNTLNFQGRLLTNTGGMVPDGSYNIEFKIYDDSIAGTNWWTENRTGGSAVTVKNGYFSAYLGDVTPFGSSIPWDQDLWMTMNVNADGEMTPRFKLTAVPYAFRAGAVTDSAGNAYTGDDLIQKAPSTVQAVNSALSAIRLNQAGAGGLLQLQGDGVDVFKVSKTGATTIAGPVLGKNTTNSTSALDVQNVAGDSFLKVDTSNSIATFGSNVGTSSTVLQGGSNGVQITSGSNVNIGQADTNGTLLVVDTKTDAGDPPGTNGAMYYNQNFQKFRCYENGAWTDCIGGGGAPYAGASVNYYSGAQNIGANQTAFPLENMVFTTATAVSNVAGVNGGFTAPADGSFRSCLVMNTANITAGTVTLRWRVNGVSVGSGACTMNNTAPTNRQSSTVLNPGVVTFQAGDLIDIAIDTSAGYTPITNDYSVYWAVEYLAGSGGSGSGGASLQDVYDQSLVASVLTANNKNIEFNLANTAIDSDFVINVASGSTSKLVVQNNGTDTFSVTATGDVSASGGLTVGNSSSITAGTIRWTGTDFEGYDGANWVSLTSGSGGGGSGVNFVSRVKQVNQSVISTIALQDDNELTFPIGANEEWTYRFVVQANAAVAADLRFAVSAPVGAVCNTATSEAENSASDAQVGCGVSSAILNGNAVPELYEITGRVQNGPTAGNITLRWAQFTLNATNTIVYAGSYVQAVRSIGAGGNGQPFAQDGNAFGETAILGTSDTQGLSIITDNVERIGISATGDVSIAGLTTLSGNLLGNRTVTGVTGTTIGTGTTTTALTLTTDAFNVNDVIFIDNVGQDYYSRITVDPGTGNYTISPAVTFETGRTVTKYNVQNIGATSTDYTNQANRFFQGYFLGGVVVGAGSTTIGDGSINSTTDLVIQSNGGNVTFGGGLTVTGSISGDGSGLTSISSASIDGATIADLDASNVTAGTLADVRLSTNVALLSGAQVFSGLKDFGAGLTVSGGNIGVTGDVTASGTLTGASIVGNGSGITSIDASNISSGTIGDGRLSTNIALLSGTQTFTGAKSFSSGITVTGDSGVTGNLNATGSITGATIVGDGAGLTGLNASNISSGTLSDSRLSTNVTLLTGSQTFTGLKTFGAGLTVSSGNADVTGDITATGEIAGATIVGDGAGLTGLNADNISSGTVADGRLSSNVALLTGSQTFSGSKTFNGGLVLGQSTISSSATVSRAVSLPDEAGTICLSNTDNCGYLRLASGAAQTDASNNDVLSVNKTSATGNLISLQRSGGAVFTVANSGALQIQSTATTALDIRNIGGTSYFSVDTNSGNVRIGSAVADAVGVLLVLDTKNTAGDPTGTDGGIYYNSNTGKFRCYEEGTWKDCIGARQVRSFIDTTVDVVADNNTTNYWDIAAENNNSVPNLSPSTTNKSITGSVSFETQSTTTADRSVVARVERSIGTPAACGGGTPVGTILSTFTTNSGEQASNTIIFMDSPNTTSTVYYTLCADTATSSAANMVISRIRITLEEANNSN